MKNIVFMGTPEYATDILSEILEAGFNVTGVFTQPDKPVGRKQILTPPHVKAFLQEKYPDIKIFQPENLKSEATHKQIQALKPEFIVVAAYGQILPKEVLGIATCINLHASILPKYRGASPIQSALLNDEKQTGVTAMLMDEGLDTGAMLDFAYTNCEHKTAGELFSELGKMAGTLIVSVLKNFTSLKPIAQNDNEASICKKIKKQSGLFSFDENANEIYNKFRAYTPWPGLFLESGLKILSLKISENFSGDAGKILKIEKDGFIVSCGTKAVKILSIQEPSKKAVSASAYINGKRLSVGDRIS
ncbi:methionyl-tRNA formyltransferase [Campylobacter suis]|uniref:Methionyl-tRNA formyltransferase n=1 Tax=Campylobacter suis TaxID=2790657 RepID=A0ABN7K4R5_9BACT|nr:methionyl-tRNA formyltransferase [Campylobacter suis]CAD7286373.1 Methionyl-tRNA formyltransferase [Campylobacter suis]